MADPIRLAFAGDLALCGHVPNALKQAVIAGSSADFVRRLRTADVTVVNLESPFGTPSPKNGLTADVRTAPLLPSLGIDLATIANNHIADAGPDGIQTTLRVLSELKIASVGAGTSLEAALKPAIFDVKGRRIGFLAFSDGRPYTHKHVARTGVPGAAWLDAELVQKAIVKLRPTVDLLVTVFHHGLNYVHYASPRQREFARLAAHAGADLVIGHHPHVLQGWERIGKTLVFYSLGELLLDPAMGNVVEPRWDQARRLTSILEVTLDKAGGYVTTFVPYRRTDDFQLAPLEGVARSEFQERMKEISVVYENYNPSVYLNAASEGVVHHVVKVLQYHLRRGNLGYLMRSIARIRLRHVRVGVHFLATRWRRVNVDALHNKGVMHGRD